MVTTFRLRILLCVSALLPGLPLLATPVPTIGPVDVTGTVVEVQWYPEAQVKGVPGMSGTLGIDRIVRPHFLVALAPYAGVTPAQAQRMTGYLRPGPPPEAGTNAAPPQLLLQLDHANREYLQRGMEIAVSSYEISGDEGGTWTRWKYIRILAASPPTGAAQAPVAPTNTTPRE